MTGVGLDLLEIERLDRLGRRPVRLAAEARPEDGVHGDDRVLELLGRERARRVAREPLGPM